MEIKSEFKITEIGEIPTEWKINKFHEVTNLITCGVAARPEYVEEGIPFLSSKNVKKNKIVFSGFNMISEEKHRELTKYNMPEKGDILYTRVGSFGEAAVIEEQPEFSIFVSLTLIKPIKEYFNSYFLSYLLNSDMYKKLAKNGTTGLAVQNLNVSVVRNYPMITPPIKEQQKIAEILSTVDEQIEQTDQLIEKTKELKKGLMQQLLTKGIGHTEFKHSELGEIPVEWEIKKLKDIAISKGSYGIGASATIFNEGKPRYLRISDINNEGILLYNDIRGFDGNDYKKYVLRTNDIVFARTGNSTGKTYLYKESDGELVYAGFLIKFSINPDTSDSQFIFYNTQTLRYQNWVSKMSFRSGQPGINSIEYGELCMPVPSLDEQKKIAEILSSVDKNIEGYEQEKSQYEELKKGLMQQLLTGKKRVKVD